MKKIMIAIAVIATAACVQAAQFNWQFTTSKAAATSFAGADVYMLLASDYDAEKTMSIDYIKTTAKSHATLSSGMMGGTTGNVNVNDSWVTEGSSYEWYAVVVSGDKYYVSSASRTSTAVADTATPATVTFGSGTALSTESNWTTAAVPEPTSGLLLLVGAAALALRRRRA